MKDSVLVRAQRLKFLNTLAVLELMRGKCLCFTNWPVQFFSRVSDMHIPDMIR